LIPIFGIRKKSDREWPATNEGLAALRKRNTLSVWMSASGLPSSPEDKEPRLTTTT
jgi:hypothetical protein